MLNSGGKKNSNSRVVRKNISERNKNHNPPCKLNGRSLSTGYVTVSRCLKLIVCLVQKMCHIQMYNTYCLQSCE